MDSIKPKAQRILVCTRRLVSLDNMDIGLILSKLPGDEGRQPALPGYRLQL